MSDEPKSRHFDYEELDRWERHLRSLGFENITVKRTYQRGDVSRVYLEMTLVPWEPLPDIKRRRDEELEDNAARGAKALRAL